MLASPLAVNIVVNSLFYFVGRFWEWILGRIFGGEWVIFIAGFTYVGFHAQVLCMDFMHGLCARALCMDFMHGLYAWALCMGFMHEFYTGAK